jgi:pimeloyl-ACP methyl ester carboxylesterase
MGWGPELTLVVRSRTVRVRSAGRATTRPPVVVVGGLGSLASDWAAVIDSVEAWTRVVWFDGIRPTGHPTECGAPVRSTADLIHDTAHAVGLTPPWLLVGHSLGGLYVQGFARLYPDLTAGVVLVDSTVSAPGASDSRVPGALRRLGWRVLRWLTVDAGGAMVFGRLARRLVVWSNTLNGRDPLPATDADQIYRNPRCVAPMVDEWMASSAAIADLGAIATAHPFPDRPVAVLVGTRHGRPSPRRDTAWIRTQHQLATLTNAVQVVELDAAHLVMLDLPRTVATTIGDLTRRA